MRSTYGNFVLPAAIAAGLAITSLVPAALAGDYMRHGAFGRNGHGWHQGHHVRRPGIRHLRTLPRLIEAPRPGTSAAVAVQVPGVPFPVPQATAGTGMTDVSGTYLFQGYQGYGLPTTLPGAGTYAGGIEAVSDPGNGNYFAVNGSLDLAMPGRVARPSAKIIVVRPDENNASCDMQKGVCIIRP